MRSIRRKNRVNPANVRQSHFETGATVIIGISSGGGEDRESTLQIIRRGGLVQLLVSNGFFSELVEKQLVGLSEVGAEPLVNCVDESG